MIIPGSLVRIDTDRVDKKLRDDKVFLWRTCVSTQDDLGQEGNIQTVGSMRAKDVGIVIARLPSLNGVAGTDTDTICVLCGLHFGWNSAHWFHELSRPSSG